MEKVEGKWKLYNGETLFDSSGQEITKEKFNELFPASITERMAVKVLNNTFYETSTMDNIRYMYNIPYGVEDEKVFEIVNQKEYANKTESTPLERIASALEYIAMTMMEDRYEFPKN